MAKTKQSSKTRQSRRWFWRVFSFIVVLFLIWSGLVAWRVVSLRAELQTLQTMLQQTPQTSQTLTSACQQVTTTANTLQQVRILTVASYPILRHVGWMPKIGTTLSAVPALSDAGTNGLQVAQTACTQFQPAFKVIDLPKTERLPAVFSALEQHAPNWALLRQQFSMFRTSWQNVPSTAFDQGPLNQYQSQAHKVSSMLAGAESGLHLVEQLWDVLPNLLGVKQAQHWLVVAQNPFELRATGGFIGSLAHVMLDQGRLHDLAYANSANYAYTAPQGSDFPQAYADYLRASIWTLRDANWWADWPLSAKTIATFWELNDQPSVDGVIGVDLYALQYVLAQFPNLSVPEYGVITDTTSLEAIYRGYEPQAGATGGNKAFLGRLFQATIERMQSASASELLAIADALYQALNERHISVYLFDRQQQQPFNHNHWDGALRSADGDYLQIVDSDLSYSDVQAFIEQRIQLDVAFQANQALTHTVTITYTNRYDDWNADQTSHTVFGYCYNPQKQIQERIAGCYGDYVRIYPAKSSIGLAVHGADSGLKISNEGNQPVFGAYLVVLPGETRTISLTYRTTLPITTSYNLIIQKQAGTLARPIVVNLNTTSIHADLWHDLELNTDSALQLRSPVPSLHPSNSRVQDDQFQAWWQGWQAWQNGERSYALEVWQQSNTLDRSLNQVNALRWHGHIDQAQQLLDALKPAMAESGRWAFLAGQLAQLRGDDQQAMQLYQQAIEREPTTQVARFSLARLQLPTNQAAGIKTLQSMQDPLRWLRQAAWEEWFAQDYQASDQTNQQILLLAPNDEQTWEDRYWLVRYGLLPTQWNDVLGVTSTATTLFPNNVIWLERQAEAYSGLNNNSEALRIRRNIVEIDPRNSLNWYYIGILQRGLGQLNDAQQALEQAIDLDHSRVEYHIALGEVYESLSLKQKALTAYQSALVLDPNNQQLPIIIKRLEANEK